MSQRAHWMSHVAFAQALDMPWICKSYQEAARFFQRCPFFVSWKETEILGAIIFAMLWCTSGIRRQVSWSRISSIQSKQSSRNKLSQHMPSLKTCFWLVPCMPAQALGSVHGHNFALTPAMWSITTRSWCQDNEHDPSNVIQHVTFWPLHFYKGQMADESAEMRGKVGDMGVHYSKSSNPLPCRKSWMLLRGDSGAPWCWRSICPSGSSSVFLGGPKNGGWFFFRLWKWR